MNRIDSFRNEEIIFRAFLNKNIAEKYERLKFVIESKTDKLVYQNGRWHRVKADYQCLTII
jgi:hypothetical protein